MAQSGSMAMAPGVILPDRSGDSVQVVREWLIAAALASEGVRGIFAVHPGHCCRSPPSDRDSAGEIVLSRGVRSS
jgi:hypothetical protein